jgi:hypothetical protein
MSEENNNTNTPAVPKASNFTPPTVDLTASQDPILNLLDRGRFDQLARAAGLFAKSGLVPKHFQNNPEACFIAMQMALRLEIDPFMLMQNMYVVHGRPGMEAKLVISLINARGPYEAPLQFEYEGEGEARACTAFGVRRGTGRRDEMRIDVALAKKMGWWGKSDSLWPKMTDQMLAYRAASWLANLYCPEVKMGLPTIDEVRDAGPIDVTPAPSLNDRLKAAKNGHVEPAAVAEVVDAATGEITEPKTEDLDLQEAALREQDKAIAAEQEKQAIKPKTGHYLSDRKGGGNA